MKSNKLVDIFQNKEPRSTCSKKVDLSSISPSPDKFLALPLMKGFQSNTFQINGKNSKGWNSKDGNYNVLITRIMNVPFYGSEEKPKTVVTIYESNRNGYSMSIVANNNTSSRIARKIVDRLGYL